MDELKTRKRLLDVYFELCIGNKLSISSIERKYGVSRRTAQRIIEDLSIVLGGLESETILRQKCWFLSDKHKKLLVFSEDDYLNLCRVRNALPDKAKEEAEFIEKFISKVDSVQNEHLAPTDVYTLLKSEGKAISQYPQEKVDEAILKTIRESILAFKKLRIQYKKKDGITTRVVCPYGLLKSTKKYLVATEEAEPKKYKHFSLSKIKSAVCIDEYFEANDDFDIEELKNKSFGVWQGEVMDVCLKFSGEAVDDAMNYNFHPTQKVKLQEDGTVLVTFQASGDKAICWELFKWGEYVEILEPKALNEEYIKQLSRVIKIRN